MFRAFTRSIFGDKATPKAGPQSSEMYGRDKAPGQSQMTVMRWTAPTQTASSRAMMVLSSTISRKEPPTWRLPRSDWISRKTFFRSMA